MAVSLSSARLEGEVLINIQSGDSIYTVRLPMPDEWPTKTITEILEDSKAAVIVQLEKMQGDAVRNAAEIQDITDILLGSGPLRDKL